MNEKERNGKRKLIMDRFKARGFRNTKQRNIIIDVILENVEKTPSIQELLEYVQDRDSTLGMATIYRTVEVLTDMGYLSLVDQGEGFNRITLADGGIKIHAFCRNCGRNIDIPREKEIAATLSQLAEDEDFKLLPQAFKICGICGECQKKLKERGGIPTPMRMGKGRGRGRGCCRKRTLNED